MLAQQNTICQSISRTSGRKVDIELRLELNARGTYRIDLKRETAILLTLEDILYQRRLQ